MNLNSVGFQVRLEGRLTWELGLGKFTLFYADLVHVKPFTSNVLFKDLDHWISYDQHGDILDLYFYGHGGQTTPRLPCPSSCSCLL